MKDNLSVYESAQDLMVCELDKLVQKNEISPSTLDYFFKIVDIIKDLDKAIINEEDRISSEEGYSMRSYPYYNRGNSSRSNRNMDYNDGYSRRNTSRSGNSYRGESRNDMLDHLYMALDTASNDDERKRVQHMIDEIERSK